MRKNVVQLVARVAMVLVLGVVGGSIWTRAQPSAAVTVIDGGALTLDAYVTNVTSPAEGLASVVVPKTRIRDRCADGDACSIRLFLSAAPGSTLAQAVKQKLFSVTAVPDIWAVHSVDGLLEDSGDINDGNTETIVFSLEGDRWCLFRDDAATQSYRLVALNVTSQPLSNCVLRIDD